MISINSIRLVAAAEWSGVNVTGAQKVSNWLDPWRWLSFELELSSRARVARLSRPVFAGISTLNRSAGRAGVRASW